MFSGLEWGVVIAVLFVICLSCVFAGGLRRFFRFLVFLRGCLLGAKVVV